MEESRQGLPAVQRLQHQVEELRERVNMDAMSGLLNRPAAEQYIKDRLRDMAPGENCALFIVDLDNFKQVNDTLGHLAGDQAIHSAAQILSRLFRASDIVGRLGGDEFVVFLSGQITETMVREKAAAICRELQIALGGDAAVNLTASVGVHLSPGGGEHFEGLYQSADLALYKAKKGGKHGFCIRGGGCAGQEPEQFQPVNTIPLTGLLEYMDSGVALLEMGETIRLLYVSPSFCRILGADPGSYAMPKPLSELVHPDDLVDLEEVLRAGLQQARPVEYSHRVSLDGAHWAWWHVRAVRVEGEDPLPIMLATTTDISRFKENERRLEEINQRLQIAFDQTTQTMWEVDVAQRTIHLFDQNGTFFLPEGEENRFPDALIDSGWVHPDSASRCREFARELLEGRVEGYCSLIIRYRSTGCYGWAALSYRMLFDEVGRASRAVGILENLPANFMGQETRAILQRPMPESLIPDLMVGLRASLTQDVPQELWLEGRDESGRIAELTCAQLLRRAAAKVFSPEERERLAPYFQREWLLERFSQGERWLRLEYQRVDAGGRVCWVSHVANLAEDPITREVYLFLYIARLDRRRAWEQAVGNEVVRDPVTGVYGRSAVRAIAERCVSGGEGENCALALIQLGGLERQFPADGGARRRQRRYLTIALSVALGCRCVLGQHSASQMLVFFPDAPAKFLLRRELEEAFAFVRLVMPGMTRMERLRFVAGVSLSRARGADLTAMEAQAESLCRLWSSSATDTVAFPHEDDDWTWTELQNSSQDDQVTVHQGEMNRPLSEGEKDVAFHCVSAMLSANSLEASLHSVLDYIGTYYHADRAYVLSLTDNDRAVTMSYEWTGSRKRSIRPAVTREQLDHFPLLKRCMEEQAPVFLTRTQPISLQGERATAAPWYFTAFPLVEHDVVLGFLCVENAREHPADGALFSTLIPYILRERGRFEKRRLDQEERSLTNLMELPNLRSYLEAVGDITSDRYSSMGAVCLDVPNLSILNSRQGFEYGSKLLWYVSKSMAELFGPTWIFRTWDAEFVALCPNTTQKIFLSRCARLRGMLQRRYPRELRLGCAWADGSFQAKELVYEARRMMRRERPDSTTEGEDLILGHGHYQSVGEAARGGRFTVYFQPKIDMRTGALFGAEALVRGVDDDGSLILPNQFIENLERSGTVRELDLFVLDQTLARLERWQRAGLGVVPISVNLSRVTLFSSTALASILAIQSRYPGVPPEALELEITESAGDVETGELRRVMDRFRQCGLRFSLDDFGSKYSNLPIFTNVKFETVKLDRSLITELASNPVNRMLIQDIIRICQTCGMNCVAEGVENEEQIAALREIGCSYAQGFYYDRPMPAEQFEEKYLRAGAYAAENKR